MNTTPAEHLHTCLQQLPLVAILRGLTPAEAPAIGQALTQAGFGLLEVPLNSPEPLASIRALRDALPADCLIGAGTVLTLGGKMSRGGASGALFSGKRSIVSVDFMMLVLEVE